ncbi:MAG: hypothetical protein KAT00_11975, partial [Planctomycetes bacterium]|nr:hypothetical protein [Planctomycetota bacterium]
MAFVATEHGALIVARIAYGSEEFSNHIWARRPDFNDAELLAVVNAVKSAYVTVLLDDFTVSTVFQTFKGYDMRTIEGSVIDDGTGNVPCTGGSNENPPNCACVLTLYTAKRGRSHRGRLFIGPMKTENIA